MPLYSIYHGCGQEKTIEWYSGPNYSAQYTSTLFESYDVSKLYSSSTRPPDIDFIEILQHVSFDDCLSDLELRPPHFDDPDDDLDEILNGDLPEIRAGDIVAPAIQLWLQ